MSLAGIRSNRGDNYQTLVALDWVLLVLTDPDYQWIEVDSVSYTVDDIVIGKTDGSIICCQCKKNQTDFKYWTVANLADELEKAAELLANNNFAHVRFYSRSPFSSLAKLREYSISQPNEFSYQKNLSKEQSPVDSALAKIIAKQSPKFSTYKFLQRTSFETSPELDRMEQGLRERLRVLVSNPEAAFNAIWAEVDLLGGRLKNTNLVSSSQHRLNKEKLKTIVERAGSTLTPNINVEQILTSFTSTSAIGRTWKREIVDQKIKTPVVSEILDAIDSGKRSILLTGLPGSGKTCIMLELQEALEQKAQIQGNIAPLFIQAREFADATTSQERHAQGLPEQWVEQAARVADPFAWRTCYSSYRANGRRNASHTAFVHTLSTV